MQLEAGARPNVPACLGASAGWPRIQRLASIMEHSVTARVAAATEAAQLLQQTWDTERFRAACAVRGTPCTADEEAWIAQTEATVQEARAALLSELSACQMSGPRDAIRRAHRALGDHFRQCGRFREALAHYESAREYAAEYDPVFQAAFAAMETAYDATEPARVLSHADQAEAALDAQARSTAQDQTIRARVMELQRSAAFQAWTLHAPAPARVLAAYRQGAWTECVAMLHDAIPVWAWEPALGTARALACHEALVQQLLARYLGAYRRLTLSAMTRVFGDAALSWLMQLMEAGHMHARVDVAAQRVDMLDETYPTLATAHRISQHVALRRRKALLSRLPPIVPAAP
ncbi:hypothetical protein MEQU1_003532 [Malassezia equina]|uniref:26S proteasome regulatory subunit Rpn7 N-terminal domain-containing protein n=1 Tax=Malassezia equina TaxID=1381935 RepID=A0AAF0ELD0_9BASI|nr:hypothetical protein MEQU1_003532 [Malassezia equina]